MSVELSSPNLAYLAFTTLKSARVGETILHIGLQSHEGKLYYKGK